MTEGSSQLVLHISFLAPSGKSHTYGNDWQHPGTHQASNSAVILCPWFCWFQDDQLRVYRVQTWELCRKKLSIASKSTASILLWVLAYWRKTSARLSHRCHQICHEARRRFLFPFYTLYYLSSTSENLTISNLIYSSRLHNTYFWNTIFSSKNILDANDDISLK